MKNIKEAVRKRKQGRKTREGFEAAEATFGDHLDSLPLGPQYIRAIPLLSSLVSLHR